MDRDEDYTGLGIDSLNAIVQSAIEQQLVGSESGSFEEEGE